MKILNKTLECQTKNKLHFIDITGQIKKFIKQNQLKNGLINIQSLHTTTAVIVNENEPLLLEDIKKNLEKIAPDNEDYHHDNFEKRTVNLCPDECANGHSHCKAIYLPVNVVLNLINGELQLGQWQSILLLELDRPKKRKIQLQTISD
jgi:secondary thiamine-phosphate synthase enzyme